MLLPNTTTQFEKDKEKAKRQKKNFKILDEVVKKLIEEQLIDPKHCDHPLKGEWKGYRDCHVQNDWVLIYKINEKEKTITFVRLGTHSELFK